MIHVRYLVPCIVVLIAISCGNPGGSIKEVDGYPPVFPDYCEVVIPPNIAPLNFRLTGSHKRIMAVVHGTNDSIRIKGRNKVIFGTREWKKLLMENQGGRIRLSVYSKQKGGWCRYKPFSIHIKEEPADPWIAYRLIAPGYETWSEMGIYQRNIETFRQKPVITNRMNQTSCVNCHSFQANDPDNMMFHLRGSKGGTVLIREGVTSMLNTKVRETISNCVYPFWHPSEDFIAFSVNNIQQVFHSVKDKRIEVFDSRSDIVIYDIKNNNLITGNVVSSEESFETFPTFSPDGKTLYFCSAKKGAQPDEYSRIKYSLCRVDFDASTGKFGTEIDTLVSASRTGKSVSFPRISPEGRFLVFTFSDYGNFSIWHREADLYQLNLESGEFFPVGAINSTETESYHSWSSNSRWMIFSSRRIDGLYTRLFITYVDEAGNFSKPFVLPQRDPDFYDYSLRSFNIPEFVKGQIRTDGLPLLRAIGSPPKDVNFERKY